MILNQGLQGADLCVVGAGPVGIALAVQCERLGLTVALLESGAGGRDEAAQDLARTEIVDPLHHAPSNLCVCRALGGTSLLWMGRCVPFDPIDFERRRHVPEGVWPITHEEVAQHHRIAADLLGCGRAVFQMGTEEGEEVRTDGLERWCAETNMRKLHAPTLNGSKNLRVHLRSTVKGLKLDESGQRIKGLELADGRLVSAKYYVLAGGGIEVTRLLLHTQTEWPRKFSGALGRFYQGHLSGRIADIVFLDRTAIGSFDYLLDDGAYVRRRWSIASAIQHRLGLLNTVFMPDNPFFYKHQHKSGTLSALYMALACEPIGKRLLPEAVRMQHVGPEPRKYTPHLRNILGDLPGTIAGVSRTLRERHVNVLRKSSVIDARMSRFPLYYHSEHAPNVNSQVTLSRERDASGLPRAVVDLRFTEFDSDSVIRSHEVIDRWLQASGIGYLSYYQTESRADNVLMQAMDGFHQVGTTRMSTNPRDGVVDENCRVHGVDNLFIASSAVLPTSSHANSTFMAVTMAVRLAKELTKAALNSSIPVKVRETRAVAV